LLLRSGHAQTVFAAFSDRVAIPYNAVRHIVSTTDGDSLVLHDDLPPGWQPGGLTVLLVHGLGGCHGSPYMVRIAHKLHARGVRVFRLDMRGCGAGFRLAQRPGHGGRSEDVAAAVEFVAAICPDSPLVVAGFSLGGNIVLKMLGELGATGTRHLVRAMAVAPPIDMLACSQNIERRSMFLYNRWFVRNLLRETELRREFNRELSQIDLSRLPRTLFEFDDRVTAPLSGFSGAREYYARSSSAPLLRQIGIPTLVLTAADDPIVPAKMFTAAERSPQVALHVTRRGGHVAYFGRSRTDPDHFWLDWRVVEFVTADAGAVCAPSA
jgi:predicted alpha/beta-fold hydrolase